MNTAIADEVESFKRELALGELLDQILISLDREYGKEEDCPEIFIRLVLTFHYEAFKETLSKEDKRKNTGVSAEILKKRQASTIYHEKIDSLIRQHVDLHCPYDDKGKYKHFILIKLMRMTVEQFYKKAWADHENLIHLKSRRNR